MQEVIGALGPHLRIFTNACRLKLSIGKGVSAYRDNRISIPESEKHAIHYK